MQVLNRRRPVTPMDTVGSYGTTGQVLTSNGPNTPPSFQTSTSTKTLTNYTGTTTASAATVFDVTDSNGVGGATSVENTGANGLQYTFTATDMYSASGSLVGTLTAGQKFSFDHQNGSGVTGVTAPFQEIKLQIQDQVGGTHTTYSVYKMQW